MVVTIEKKGRGGGGGGGCCGAVAYLGTRSEPAPVAHLHKGPPKLDSQLWVLVPVHIPHVASVRERGIASDTSGGGECMNVSVPSRRTALDGNGCRGRAHTHNTHTHTHKP